MKTCRSGDFLVAKDEAALEALAANWLARHGGTICVITTRDIAAIDAMLSEQLDGDPHHDRLRRLEGIGAAWHGWSF